MGGNKRSEAAGTSRRSLAALQKEKRKRRRGEKRFLPVFLCALSFFPMTEECAASSTYQHVSPSSGECSPPPPDVFLRSLSAELLCDCSSLRLSALIPVFSSAALVTTSYGLQTHSSSCLHSEKSEGQYVMTGSGLIGLIKQCSLIKTDVFSLFSGELKETGPSPKLQALLQTGRIRSGPH